MTKLLVLCAVALAGSCVCACGASKPAGDAPAAPPPAGRHGVSPASSVVGAQASAAKRGATDANDGDFLTPVDRNDDSEVVEYGHPATPSDQQKVEAFAKRYYPAATAANGRVLCSLLVSSFARTLPQEFGGNSTPAYLRGRTCAAVMSKLYTHRHVQMLSEDAGFRVTSVRVNGNKAYALMAFTAIPERRYIALAREHGVWKMSEELIDAKFP